MSCRRFELAIFLLWLPVASFLSSYLGTRMLGTLFFFLIVPCIVLFWITSNRWNALIFSLLVAIPAAVLVDPIAQATGTWIIYSQFPKFLGLSIEGMLWTVFTSLIVTLAYERFWKGEESLELWNDRKESISKYLWAGTSVYFVFILFLLPSSFVFPYFYLVFGVPILIFPHLKAYSDRLQYYGSLLPVAAVFAVYFLVYEWVALNLANWGFPGNATSFIGFVSIIGHRFPFEEFIFYILLLAPTIIVYYDHWCKRI